MRVLAYDSETTGIPEWKIPSGDPAQPHLVQLSGILADTESREIITELDLIIRPDGWVIPQETVEIHGISQERALAEGIPEQDAVAQFLELWDGSFRIAHNRTFDQRILRIALKRYFSEEVQNAWADKESHDCTMWLSKKAMSVGKNPKLTEAYEWATGKVMEGNHNALCDARACLELYFALLDIKEAA